MRSYCRAACNPYHIYFIFTMTKSSKKGSGINIRAGEDKRHGRDHCMYTCKIAQVRNEVTGEVVHKLLNNMGSIEALVAWVEIHSSANDSNSSRQFTSCLCLSILPMWCENTDIVLLYFLNLGYFAMANEHMTTGESDGKKTQTKNFPWIVQGCKQRNRLDQSILHMIQASRQKELKLLQNYQTALQCLYTTGIVEKWHQKTEAKRDLKGGINSSNKLLNESRTHKRIPQKA